MHTRPGGEDTALSSRGLVLEGLVSLWFPHFRPLLPHRQVSDLHHIAQLRDTLLLRWDHFPIPHVSLGFRVRNNGYAPPCRLGRWLSDGLRGQQRSCPALWPQTTSSAPPAYPALQTVL